MSNKIDLKQFASNYEQAANPVSPVKLVKDSSSLPNKEMVTTLKLKVEEDENKNKIDLGAISYQKRAEQNKVYGKAKEIPPNIVEEIRAYLINNHQKMLQESFMNNEKRAILESIVIRYITKHKIVVPGFTAKELQTKVIDAVAGLGPLQPLADDVDITEIMVNGKDEVIIEKFGKEIVTNIKFASNEELDEVTMKIVNASGMTLTSAKPYVDCRFPSMRINIANGLISGIGTVITIRKFAPVLRISEKTIIESGQASKEMLNLLEAIMRGRKNVLVVGPTGSGKTELLKYMFGDVPDNDRTLVLEDTAEMYLRDLYPHKHVIPMECRFTDDEDTTVDYAVLLKNVLRQNPNRVWVGETRGSEALLMLEILNTGHPGASTAHANSARDAVERLIMMCLRAGMNLDTDIIGKWVTKVFDFIVFQRKMDDGVRRTLEIIKLDGYSNGNLQSTQIFGFEETNVEIEDGVVSKIEGKHVQTGYLDIETARDILKVGVEKEKIINLITDEDKELLGL